MDKIKVVKYVGIPWSLAVLFAGCGIIPAMGIDNG